jgi:hypothetical protein
LDNPVEQLATRALISDNVDVSGIFKNVHKPNNDLVIHLSQEHDFLDEATRLV